MGNQSPSVCPCTVDGLGDSFDAQPQVAVPIESQASPPLLRAVIAAPGVEDGDVPRTLVDERFHATHRLPVGAPQPGAARGRGNGTPPSIRHVSLHIRRTTWSWPDRTEPGTGPPTDRADLDGPHAHRPCVLNTERARRLLLPRRTPAAWPVRPTGAPITSSPRSGRRPHRLQGAPLLILPPGALSR